MFLVIDCVPYRFRSSFRDWAAERTDAPHAVMEAALARAMGLRDGILMCPERDLPVGVDLEDLQR